MSEPLNLIKLTGNPSYILLKVGFKCLIATLTILSGNSMSSDACVENDGCIYILPNFSECLSRCATKRPVWLF